MNKLLPSLLLLLIPMISFAGIEVHSFTSAQKEKDYKQLTAELRCLVCQNQNLADSNADLAVDLRNQVYKMLNEGKSRQEILDYMVSRYGDFVLYRPPLDKATIFLWGGPALIVLLGLLGMALFIRNHRLRPEDLDESETENN
ncbi:MAG: cytochrome c-type biogenesis protein [Thiotrichales bacterium]